MLVREILEGADEFPTIVTDAPVRRAAELMRNHDVRAVPVVEGDKLVGIVTDWDVVDAFSQRADGLADLPVSAIMTGENLITIDIDASVAEAAVKLAEHRVHHLPVTNEGKYVGLVCLGLEWTAPNMLAPPVRPTMTARHP